VTKFASQAILGVQATYQFTDTFGLYAACDWRLGDTPPLQHAPNG